MEKKKQEKATYDPPVLRRIELRAQEVLGNDCKTASISYPGTAAPCGSSGCSLSGAS
jgi:hypothetical protein